MKFMLNIQLFADDKDPQPEKMTANEYAEEIKKLKANTVPKEEFDKVNEEKKTLVRALAEGVDIPEAENQEKKPDIKELRKKILTAGETGLSNAEFVQTALDLRKALLAEGKKDPFLPAEIKRKATKEDINGAEKVAEFFQDCLDQSRGENGKVDEIMFNAILQRGIANDSPATARMYQEWAQKINFRK